MGNIFRNSPNLKRKNDQINSVYHAKPQALKTRNSRPSELKSQSYNSKVYMTAKNRLQKVLDTGAKRTFKLSTERDFDNLPSIHKS